MAPFRGVSVFLAVILVRRLPTLLFVFFFFMHVCIHGVVVYGWDAFTFALVFFLNVVITHA